MTSSALHFRFETAHAHTQLPFRHRISNPRNVLKLYGYAETDKSPEEIVPETLAEVTLVARPDELRRVAKFLEFCANEMERMGEVYDHVHLSDRDRSFEGSPHLVVARDDYGCI